MLQEPFHSGEEAANPKVMRAQADVFKERLGPSLLWYLSKILFNRAIDASNSESPEISSRFSFRTKKTGLCLLVATKSDNLCLLKVVGVNLQMLSIFRCS